jgi:MerR family transcriptional regulator, light-induced transcriptional regulator
MLYNPVMAIPTDSDLPSGDGLFPIRHVCAETGINPVTLRAWERRYGLIRPLRTPKGHRLYSSEDIARVRRILELLDEGVAVSRVGRVLQHDAHNAEGSGSDRSPPLTLQEPTRPSRSPAGGIAPHVRDPIAQTLLETTRELSTVQLERIYARLVMRHGWDGVHERAFLEAYDTLRDAARHDPGDEARFAVFTTWASTSLSDQLRSALLLCEGPTCPCVVPASGHRRLSGLLLLLASARQGLRVLPFQDIISPAAMQILIDRYAAPAIVVHTPSRSLQGSELERLQRLLRADGVPVFLAGEGAPGLSDLNGSRSLVVLPAAPLEAADRLSRQLLGAAGR